MTTRTLSRLLIVLLIAAVQTAFASDSGLQKQLNDNLKNKILTLRQPDSSRDMRFDGQGSRIGSPAPGAWYENVRLLCSRITIKRDELTIEGKRVTVSFDPKERKFMNLATNDDVRIKIGPGVPLTDMAALSPVLNKVFLSAAESLAEVAPDYWSTCLRGEIKDGRCEGQGHDRAREFKTDSNKEKNANAASSSQIFRVGGAIKAPRAIHDPEPEYSSLARKARLQGACMLWVVIGADGKTDKIQIVRPLGLGLDDQAVEAVRHWTFQPATKDGEPVAVQANIQVNFRLLR